MAEADMFSNLPNDCCEFIFKRLPNHHLAEVSLVCKRFLFITNSLLLSLTVRESIIPLLPRIFRRFTNIKHIDLSEVCDKYHPDDILSQLSNSKSVIEFLDLSNNLKGFPRLSIYLCPNMRNLRVFQFRNLRGFIDEDLMAVVDACPLLEDIDINLRCPNTFHVVTDEGIVYLSMRLKRLQTLRMSNHLVTDKSLHALVSNCSFIKEIEFVHRRGLISSYGIASVIRKCAIVTMKIFSFPILDVVKESFVHAKALCELDLYGSTLSDELLYSMAEAQLSLTTLNLGNISGVTSPGIITLLSKTQSLQHLDLPGVDILTDQDIIALTNFLSKLYSINLSWCYNLTSKSFFALVRRCPLLNEIRFSSTNLTEVDDSNSYVMSSQIKILDLSWNRDISTDCLMKVLSVCPKLEELGMSGCREITTNGGMMDILRFCPELQHLKMASSTFRSIFDMDSRVFDMDSRVFKLEILEARRSSLCDKTLEIIANRCKGLLYLGLSKCSNVTSEGVRKIIENCRLLKKINLTNCNIAFGDIISWTVISRPSLRIILPTTLHPPEDQWNHFSFEDYRVSYASRSIKPLLFHKTLGEIVALI